MSSTIISGLLTSLFGQNGFTGFFQSILNGIEGLLTTIFGGIGQAISEVFQGWGYSVVQTYGVWAPAGLAIGIGAAVAVGYLIMDGVEMERDIMGGEEAL